MTERVRRGLGLIASFADSWLEADGWETPERKDALDMLAAYEWMDAAGIHRNEHADYEPPDD